MQNEYYRGIINSDMLKIQELPESLRHRTVEIIVFPSETKSVKIDFESVKGIWKDSAIDLKSIRNRAWER